LFQSFNPTAMDWAIGLQRLLSRAVMTIDGLMVSIILTLLYVPLF